MEIWEAELAATKMRTNEFMKNNINNYVNADKNNALRLREAIISNSRVTNAENKNPLDMSATLNQNAGTVAISYMNGVSGTGPIGSLDMQQSNYIKANNTYSFKDRKFSYETTSSDAMVKLTMPYIWTGLDRNGNANWCGFNYVPLQNSIAIMGNKESGKPLILNYMPSNPSVLLPALKPGELALSGYGNNYLHFSQSDKITLHCESKEGQVDMDDPNYLDSNNTNPLKTNVANCQIDVQFNANDRMISIYANEDSSNPDVQYNMYNMDARQPNKHQHTKILITPTDIDIITIGDMEDDKTGTTHISLTDNGIICEVLDGKNQTKITQTATLIKKEYNSQKYTIEEEISENNISKKVINKNDSEKITEEIITDESFIINTKTFKVNTKELAEVYSEDSINIKTNEYEHVAPGSPIHTDDKKHKITIDGCDVEILHKSVNHNNIITDK